MGQEHYLQTSPEFFLKRLLCAHHSDIYSLAKVFRQGEKGHRHQPEFTLLEWYRVAWDEHQLMDEVITLVRQFLPKIGVLKWSYRELFQRYLHCDPHILDASDLKAIAQSNIDADISGASELDKNGWLDILMTHCIEPQLPMQLVVIYDYPASQAALAQLGRDAHGHKIARRFEVYLNRVELANGYFELTDAREQQRRFEQDQQYRRRHDLADVPYDEQLVAALHSGMPACAGVALGVDRLLMQLCKQESINAVMSFAH